MKKYLVIFIVFFSIVLMPKTLAIFDDEVIITTGENTYYNYINHNGDILINGHINWYQQGVYNLNYYNDNQGKFFKKDVLVTDNNKLKDGVNFYKEEKLNIDYEIDNIIKINDNEYFVITKNLLLYEGCRYQENYFYPTLKYYKDNRLVWEFIYSDQISGDLIDVVESDAGFLVLGHYLRDCFINNIFIFELSRSGELIRKKEIMGSRYDRAIGFYYRYDQIFIAGVTRSTDLDFEYNTNSNGNVFIVFMDYIDFHINSLACFGNDNQNEIYDFKIFDGVCYLLVRFSNQGGQYRSPYSFINIDAVIGVDIQNPQPTISFLPTSIDRFYLGMYKEGKEIAIYQIQQYNTYIEKQYTKFVKYICNYRIDILDKKEQYYYLNDIGFYNVNTVYDDSGFIMSSKQADRNRQGHYNYSIIYIDKDLNIEVLYEANLTNISNLYYKCILKMNDLIYIFYKDQEVMKTIKFSYFKLQDGNLYINNKEINKRELRALSNVNLNVFGMYQKHYQYQTGNVTAFIAADYYVDFKTNVIAREVYETNIRVTFNGQGYLNDYLISSGYEITEEGKYLLEVIGKDEQKLINFEVKKIAQDVETINNDFVPAEYLLFSNAQKNASNIHFDDLILNSTNNSLPIINFILLFIISFMVGIASLIMYRKVRKK